MIFSFLSSPRRRLKVWLWERYVLTRKFVLAQWTKIPEKSRAVFWKALGESLNYLANALLISVPVSVLTGFSYWKSVLCTWIILPFVEHYYVWFHEGWKGKPEDEE